MGVGMQRKAEFQHVHNFKIQWILIDTDHLQNLITSPFTKLVKINLQLFELSC